MTANGGAARAVIGENVTEIPPRASAANPANKMGLGWPGNFAGIHVKGLTCLLKRNAWQR